MDEKCALAGCRELRKHESAYCSDDCYAEDLWRVVGEFSRKVRRRLWLARARSFGSSSR